MSTYNRAVSFSTHEEICNANPKRPSNSTQPFSCFLYELPFKLEVIGFGYIALGLIALLVFISIFGGIKEQYKLFILFQALWDIFLIYDFLCESPTASDGNRGYWVTGIQTKGPSCFYSTLKGPLLYKIIKNLQLYAYFLPTFLLSSSRFLCVFFSKFYSNHTSTLKIVVFAFLINVIFMVTVNTGVIVRLSSGKFQGFEDYSGRVLRCYQLYCFGSCNSSSFDRCQKEELQNFYYNLFDCFPKVFPSIFLIFSVLFSISLIAKIGQQLKYQIHHKKDALLHSLRISVVCLMQAALLSIVFGISLFAKFPEIYDLGANGGTMWTDVDTFYKNLPLWLAILKEPLTVKAVNLLRIALDSVMILVVLKGYRSACCSTVIWFIKSLKNPRKCFQNLGRRFSNTRIVQIVPNIL